MKSFKLLARLLAVFGLMIISSISLLGAGNTCGSATPISFPSVTQDSVQNATDVDYYSFTVTNPGSYLFYTANRSGDNPDTYGTLYNSDCSTIIATDDNTKGDRDFQLKPTLANGNYVLKISKGSLSNTGNYYLYAYDFSHTRDFSIAYKANETGGIVSTGNILLCSMSGGSCQNTATTNNSLTMSYIDIDGNATTVNSSSADVNLSGATVLWAGLYWQGSNIPANYNENSAKTLKFKHENGNYVSISSDPSKFNYFKGINSSGNTMNFYQGAADVTSIVSQYGTGKYFAADIHAGSGANSAYGFFGGWNLVVVYTNPTKPFKNLTVFDGYKILDPDYGNQTSFTLSGFLTPTNVATPIESEVSLFAAEGESYSGDSMTLTDPTGAPFPISSQGSYPNIANNIFDSSITYHNSNITTRNPSVAYTTGIDIDTFEVGKNSSGVEIIGHNQTFTTVNLTTNSDTYAPGMIAISTDIYQPYLCYQEDIFNSAGTLINGVGVQVNKDDVLKVRVTVKNDGNENAQGVQVLHTFDNTKFPYKTGTTNYDNFNSLFVHTQVSPASDSSGNDLFDYDGGTYLAKIRLGEDANSTDGGIFVPFSTQTQAYSVYEYNATVKQLDQNFSNEYFAAYKSSIAGGLDYSNAPVKMEPCLGGKNSFWGYQPPESSAYGDFIDTSITTAALSTAYNASIDTGSLEGNPVSSSLKFIKTKKAGETVPLTAVYLNDSGINTDYNNGGKDVDKALWIAIPVLNDITKTGTCSAPNSAQLQQIIDPSTSKQAVFTIKDTGTANYSATKNVIIPVNASKNAKIEMITVDTSLLNDEAQNCVAVSSTTGNLEGLGQCVNSQVQYVDAYGQTAYDRCAVSTTYGQPCKPSNNGVGTGLFNSSLGCFMCTFYAGTGCSSDNFAIRPNEFNSSLTTGQQFQAGASSAVVFYANKVGGSGTTDYNESEIASPPSFAVDLNISDSTKTCAQPSLHFDPRVAFTNGLVSGPYKITNVGDFNVTMHEINGSEFALVDVDDTGDLQRFITPSTRQIKVVPHHFGLDGNFTNRSNGFTYLSNFEDYNTSESRNISAALDFNITAQDVDNNATSNYTELCYAKDGNVTMTLANALVVNPVGSLTKMLWYDQNHDTNGSIALGGTTYSMDMNATQFDSVDVNGTAQVKYLINFDRNQKFIVDPMNMTISQVVATDTDLVSGTKVLTANNSANYLYGRIVPRDIRIFGANTPFSANAWYEVYNASGIGATALPISKNDALWYTNILHNDVNDGDATVTQVQTNGAASAASPSFDINTFTAGVETYSETTGWPLNGYKAHIDTVPWLWYGMNALNYLDPLTGNLESACLTHPCFNINVVPAVGATGSAKAGAETKKASKKSTGEGGAGGWKSTSDYAPAIR